MWRIFQIIGGFFLDIIETAVFALSIFVLIYVFLAQPHQVSGRSMVPTFQNGEFLLTNKLAYKRGLPQRGDIVIFRAPSTAHCPSGGACDFIKRIIALPGETIVIRNGHIYIDGEELIEPYIPSEYVTRGDAFLRDGVEYAVNEGEYFMIGDNRPGSSDSRAFGPVPLKNFIGKGWIRYWPFNKLGFIPAGGAKLTSAPGE